MDTISGSDTIPSVEDKLSWAEMYLSGGWYLFIVRENKTTFPSCTECKNSGFDHNKATCGHLHCHGFYAATSDIDRIRKMFVNYPNGLLALRTGQPSGVIALDFDVRTRSVKNPNTGEVENISGIDVLENWHGYTGGVSLPSETLTARTQSGGYHLLYKTDSALPSRNLILPSVDLKADNGYVVLSPSPGYRWERRGLSGAPADLVNFLTTKRGKSFAPRRAVGRDGRTVGGAIGGEPIASIMRTGCSASGRDEFANTLIFQLRKIGMSYADIIAIMREQWQIMEHPDGDVFHWHWIQYKIDKIWQTVKPDEDELPEYGKNMLAQTLSTRRAQLERGEVVQVGRRAVTRHMGRDK